MPKYSDLFTLHPIETVIKIEAADKKAEARRLVNSFVITQSLGQQIVEVALPQLDFTSSVEGKGIFVVGNYGTGKSHVMSFLSIIAENEDYLQQLRDETWQEKLRPIAGKYKVRRLQIAASLQSLYEIVTEQLQRLASECSFKFTFKDQRQLANIKEEFSRFMAEFESHHPNMGVLLIVDELLHYLETRNDQDMHIDLGVLQALGEFCDGSRFIFMAGLQQSLFNNPRFNHMASSINRIRQRYNDFIIDNKGVAQLIEQYLFEKTDDQKKKIRELIQPLGDLYEDITPTKLDQYVALFPAHPDFIEEFQNVFVVERREILKVLSKQAAKMQDDEVSTEILNLITADDYWPYIVEDQGLRANSDIVKIIQNVSTIQSRINSEFIDSDERDAALRLIYGLAVNRLTTTSITDQVGLKPQELKNRLLWRAHTVMHDAKFLTARAKQLLDKTREAVNGQFLTFSDINGQYYIDPTRIVDYDQQVETFAKTSITRDIPQRYLNELYTRALELDNEDPVITGRLWEYNSLIWTAKNVARPGWLFFGFPNERSTAKPPKDFYLFIIPSHRITGLADDWPDAQDESYWFTEDFDEAFLEDLTRYASANELALQSRGDDATAFKQIAKRYQGNVMGAFINNADDWLKVRWNGQRKSLGEWVNELAPGRQNSVFRTKLEAVSEVMFASFFESKFPNYPVFEVKITENTRAQAAQNALEIICKQGMATDTGRKVLKSLQLYDGDTPTPDRSPWLQIIRDRLKEIGPGQVLNNEDLFEIREDRKFMKSEPIEAEWLHVVLAAGIEAGDLVVIGPNNTKFGAAELSDFYRNVTSWEKIIRVATPAEVPVAEWRKLFKLLGVNEGLLATPGTYKEALEQFHARLNERIQQLVETREKLKGSLPFAPEDTTANQLSDTSDFDAAIKTLESLRPLNTRAKMQNLKMNSGEIDLLAEQLSRCKLQEEVLRFFEDEQVSLSALRRFEDILGEHQAFRASAEGFRNLIATLFNNPEVAKLDEIRAALANVTREATRIYEELKKRYTLDKEGDNRKKTILTGEKLKRLNKLVGISVLNRNSLEQIINPFSKLIAYRPCSEDDLLKSPTGLCPLTKFDPKPYLTEDSLPAIDLLAKGEEDLENLLKEWTTQLLNELKDPAVKSAMNALKPADRQLVDQFLESQELPDQVDDQFVRVINEALSGLITRPVKASSFARQIFGDGTPLKEKELRDRFDQWLRDALGEDSRESIRFILEE